MLTHILNQVHHVYGIKQATGVKCSEAICTVFQGHRPIATAVLYNKVIDHLYPILSK